MELTINDNNTSYTYNDSLGVENLALNLPGSIFLLYDLALMKRPTISSRFEEIKPFYF